MKNYHLAKKIIFTYYKWIAIDITLRPISDALFRFSIDYKKSCSMPGLFVSLQFLRLFSVWFSIYDERAFDPKKKSLFSVHAHQTMYGKINPAQLEEVDGLLSDFVYLSPRLDQVFHKYNNLPPSILTYKDQFNDLSKDMENHLRGMINENR